MNLRLVSLILPFLFSIAFTTTVAQQWNSYRGPNGDGTVTAVNDFTGALKVHWKVPTDSGFSSFTIADDTAVTLVSEEGQEACIALNASDGSQLWSTKLGSNKYDGGGGAGARGNKGGDGPRSTPTIDDGLVYIYDAHMNLYCLELETGKKVWSHNIKGDFGGNNIRWQNAISPVVDDERVFVCGGGEGQSMLAFDKKSGEVVWKVGNETMTHASPVLTSIDDTQQVIFFMKSGMIALDPKDGKQLWRNEFDYRTSTAASPVIFGNNVFGSAGYGVGAKLFEVKNNIANLVWEKPNRLMNHWSTPVYHDGHLYGMFSFKKYGRGPMQCVDPTTGEVKWSENGFGPGNCIIVNDKVVALSDTGELVIVEATPEKYSELSRNKVLEGKCWSMPSFHEGKLYLRSTTEGTCVSFE
jgi:outer membrane protein assembly factor BamB